MNILITNNHLKNYAGSELTTLDLAKVFNSRGHSVIVAAFEVGEPFSKHFEGIADVYDINTFDKDTLENEVDLVWCHHNRTYEYLKERTKIMHSCPSVFYSQGPYHVLERLPEDMYEQTLILNVSEETESINGKSNGILRPGPWWRDLVAQNRQGPYQDYMISNHISDAAAMLFDYKKDIKVIGEGHETTLVNAELLKDASSIVSIGRTVYLALCMNIPIYCFDHFGGPGWIEWYNWLENEKFNYSGRGPDQLKYPTTYMGDHVEYMVKEQQNFFIKRYELETQVRTILALNFGIKI
jgi:hypothetical protein